jgi:hypothetical protein
LDLLAKWLRGDNPWSKTFTISAREQSYALEVQTGKVRECEGPREEDHMYLDCRPGELPGTTDLEAESTDGKSLLVLDYKTGFDPGPVSTSGQLKSLAFASASGRPKRQIIVGYLHAPKDLSPAILTETLTADELIDHRMSLAKAMARIGDGSLTPGEHCTYCPAFMICPAQRSSLVHLGATGPLSRERVGEIHQTLATFRHLEERLRPQLAEWVRANGPAVRPDGKLVDFVKRPYSNLSQASIKRHLPIVEAEKLLAKLKATGCIEEGEREELRATNDG